MNYENLNEETRMAIHNEWLDISYKLGINSEDGKFSISDIRKAFYAGINSVLKQLGWHPASELPPVDRNGNSEELVAITSDNLLMMVYFHYESKEYNFWVESDWNKQVNYGVNVKYWCYPPKED